MDEMVEYEVVVHTGDLLYSGTNSTVYITVFGEKGQTTEHVLDKQGHDDFENSSIEHFSIKDASDVGEIQYIKIAMKKAVFHDDWYIKTICVTKKKTTEARREGEGGGRVEAEEGDSQDLEHSSIFLCYEWVTIRHEKKSNSIGLIYTTNKTSLPQKENEVRRSARALEIQQRRSYARWAKEEKEDKKYEHFPNFAYVEPGLLNMISKRLNSIAGGNIHPNLDFYHDRERHFNNVLITGVGKLVPAKLGGFFNPLDTLEEYEELARDNDPREPVSYLDRWKTDEEFGRQVLHGVNPCHITRCDHPDQLPKHFPVTDSHVSKSLLSGLSLEEEMQAGNIFFSDHKILDGIETGDVEGKKLKVASPLALFYIRPDKKFVPIAIQLLQQPAADNPIWTPDPDLDSDADFTWLLVKLFWKNADAQVARIKLHLITFHFLLEPFAMALYRNLSASHPIYKLLREHLQFVVAINARARDLLISSNGFTGQTISIGRGSSGIIDLVERCLKDLTFDVWDFVENSKRRNVQHIPNNYHYEDGSAVWDIINKFVQSIIDAFYDDDSEVVDDEEIQNWIKDIYESGFPEPDKKKIPASFTSKDQLMYWTTAIIFNASAGHSYANFQQYRMYRFIPNYPGIVLEDFPKPEDKGKITMDTIIKVLPDKSISTLQASLAWGLSQYSANEVYLGQYPRWLFTDEDETVNEARETFMKDLDQLSAKITERCNQQRANNEIPYTVLMPMNIPSGIAI